MHDSGFTRCFFSSMSLYTCMLISTGASNDIHHICVCIYLHICTCFFGIGGLQAYYYWCLRRSRPCYQDGLFAGCMCVYWYMFCVSVDFMCHQDNSNAMMCSCKSIDCAWVCVRDIRCIYICGYVCERKKTYRVYVQRVAKTIFPIMWLVYD